MHRKVSFKSFDFGSGRSVSNTRLHQRTHKTNKHTNTHTQNFTPLLPSTHPRPDTLTHPLTPIHTQLTHHLPPLTHISTPPTPTSNICLPCTSRHFLWAVQKLQQKTTAIIPTGTTVSGKLAMCPGWPCLGENISVCL